MTSQLNDSRTEILFKKNAGVTLTLLGASLNQEFILQTNEQIRNQDVPDTAPIDLSVPVTYSQPNNSLATTSFSSSKQYLVKYEKLQLTKNLQTNFSYTVYHPDHDSTVYTNELDVNLLVNPIYSYGCTVYVYADATKTILAEISQQNSNITWYYDLDSGIITFYGTEENLNYLNYGNPLITFWRYEGTYGNSTGATGVTGSIQYSDGNGNFLSDTGLVYTPSSTDEPGSVVLQGNFLPSDGTYSLGVSDNQWNDLYVQNVNATTLSINGDMGTNGQVLQSTGEGIQWVDNNTSTAKDGPTGVTGPTGPTGPGGIYANDTWLFNNLLNQPPAITFNGATSVSNAITIEWNYLDIVQALGQLLPNITEFSLYISPNEEIPTYIFNGNTGAIKYDIDDIGTTRLILSKTTEGTTGYFSSDKSTYYYKNLTLNNSLTNTNSVTAWYSNNNTRKSINVSSLSFSGYTPAGNPSKVLEIFQTTYTNNIQVTFDRPTYADELNQLTEEIISYTIYFYTDGSTYRYGGPISETRTTIDFTSSSFITELYPYSIYKIKIIATNDSGNTGSYSDADEINSAVTTGLEISPFINNVDVGFASSSFCTGTIYNVGNTTAITKLVKYNTTLTSDNFTIPIHTFNKVGSTDSNIMTLTSELSGTVGPSISYSGFPIVTIDPTTLNNITITTNSISDKYNTSNDYNQGFFLNATDYVTINSSAYNSPSNTLTLTQHFNDTSSGSKSYTFYYDSQLNSTGPNGGISSITLPGGTYVSGIKVLDGNSSITINSDLTNMGVYFYKSTLIDYSIKNNTTTLATSSITTIPSTSISDNKIVTDSVEGKISFSNGVLIDTSTFYENITISGTSYNPHTSSTIPSVTLTKLIIDNPSVSLLSEIPDTIPYANSSYVTGCRIWSAPSISDTKYTNLNYTNTNNSKTYNYYEITYNHEWNISGNTGIITSTDTINPSTELQVCNGYFKTNSSSDGYMNYSLTSTVTITNNYNNPNYSSISSTYRYATFAWKLTPTSSSYSKLSFKIPFIGSSTSITINAEGLLLINGTALDIYYMFQNTSSSSYNSTTFNSVWINANSVTSPQATNLNFYNVLNNGILFGTSTNSYNNYEATFNVFIPNTIFPVLENTYLYCRIGLPMNVNTWFNYISSTIS